ncbi:MAG: sporulation stage IV protein A [[Clostridium] scindens]
MGKRARQAEDLIRYIKDAKESRGGIWSNEYFWQIHRRTGDGCSHAAIKMAMHRLVERPGKNCRIPCRKIVNDSNGGLVCIII